MALRSLLILLALLIFSAAPAVAAQENRDAGIAEIKTQLAQIASDVERERIDKPAELERRLRALRDASRERLDPLQKEIARVEASKAALGPRPEEGAPPESKSLQDERASIDARLAQLNSEQVQITANITQATDLLTQLSSLHVKSIYSRLVERGPPLYSPSLWKEGAASAVVTGGKIGDYFTAWLASKEQKNELGMAIAFIAAALALSLFLFGPVNRWISESYTSRIEKYEPTRSRRVVVAGLKMIALAGPGIVGGLIVFITLRSQGLITHAGADAARAAWFGLVAVLLVNGFVSGFLISRSKEWRITPLVAEQGRAAGRLLVAIVAIFGLKTFVAEIAHITDAAPAIYQLIDGTSAVASGLLLFFLCRGSLWLRAPEDEAASESAAPKEGQPLQEKPADGAMWTALRRFGRLISVLTIIAPFAGYIEIADFVISRIYYLAIILSLAWFIRAVFHEIAALTAHRLQGGHGAKPADEGRGLDLFWVFAAFDTIFALALIPALLVLAGYHWSYVRDLIGEAFFGFQVGGVRIPSLAKIFTAVGVFIAILALTRLVQRGLVRGPFAHSRVDPGVQNSLTTLIGYGGLIIALLVGVTALGFSLSNLAIIAGALSVGIGFGLQSIVNNFVSGLILLFERPIKVGDWIVTASGEGTVRKISVRATEIETFDRSSIIVPNSELISSAVTNWTHKNKIGRVTIKVGVSYSSDPVKVREILLKCARDHPLVVRYPEPFVVWRDFGDSSLDFDVRAYLRDITNILTVGTDLRYAIFKAFKEAGIEIPFPQRDVYVKMFPDGGPKDHAPPSLDIQPAAQPSPAPREIDLDNDGDGEGGR